MCSSLSPHLLITNRAPPGWGEPKRYWLGTRWCLVELLVNGTTHITLSQACHTPRRFISFADGVRIYCHYLTMTTCRGRRSIAAVVVIALRVVDAQTSKSSDLCQSVHAWLKLSQSALRRFSMHCGSCALGLAKLLAVSNAVSVQQRPVTPASPCLI